MAVAAATAASARDIQLRAYLHDPLNPVAQEITIAGKAGAKTAIAWRVEGWSEPVSVSLETAELLFQAKDGSLAAKAVVPAEARQLLVVLVRDPAEKATPPYRALVLDGAPAAFPWGSSQAVSLLGVETAIEAGEHRLRLAAGKVTKIPPVTKRDEFNMAQVNFFMSEEENWVPFTERRVQFVPDLRRVFLVHATPGSQQPFVTTLTDHQPRREPGT